MNERLEQPGRAGTTSARPRVVVGVDGSPGSRAALVQGILAAARRAADVEVVSSYAIELYYLGGAPLDVPELAGIRDDTERRAQELIDEVRADEALSGTADVDVRLDVVEGAPAQVLVDRSAGTALLVVGSRGRGVMRSALLGSVALHCVTHADCPVLVVHPPVDGEARGRVVVGVDGSAGARAALAAAVDEAVARDAQLEVVAIYAVADYWTDMSSVILPTLDEVEERLADAAAQVLAEVLAERTAEGGGPAPRTTTVVVDGPPGEVLVDRGRGADLLVVGSRGHGTLRGLLLGSVALHCAMHALCPVLVVHPQRSRSDVHRGESAPAMADH